MIVIREGEAVLYGYSDDKTLFNFYEADAIPLSTIGAGATTTYEIEITFPIESENKWQGMTTGFDIAIGVDGVIIDPIEEPVVTPAVFVGVGGGAGGLLPLRIHTIELTDVTTNSVVIEWITNRFATSKIIYDTLSGQFNLNAGAPSYGYRFYQKGDDFGEEKVTTHRLTLTGLTPGTKYYYRIVSYASLPTITKERYFITLGVAPVAPVAPVVPVDLDRPIIPIPVDPADPIISPVYPYLPPVDLVDPVDLAVDLVDPDERELGFVAAAAMVFEQIGESPLLIIIVILCLIGLAIIGIKEWKLLRKRRRIIK